MRSHVALLTHVIFSTIINQPMQIFLLALVFCQKRLEMLMINHCKFVIHLVAQIFQAFLPDLDIFFQVSLSLIVGYLISTHLHLSMSFLRCRNCATVDGTNAFCHELVFCVILLTFFVNSASFYSLTLIIIVHFPSHCSWGIIIKWVKTHLVSTYCLLDNTIA